ncbi:hypothetical protein HDU98_000513 [Podochytrium sp. JEL0797]|nr:hypothetical protein HDU98_000513 [Podochytrium sp. JEL0797]
MIYPLPTDHDEWGIESATAAQPSLAIPPLSTASHAADAVSPTEALPPQTTSRNTSGSSLRESASQNPIGGDSRKWNCPSCEWRNNRWDRPCFKCGAHRGDKAEHAKADWECASCGDKNFSRRVDCFKCKAKKPQNNENPEKREAIQPQQFPAFNLLPVDHDEWGVSEGPTPTTHRSTNAFVETPPTPQEKSSSSAQAPSNVQQSGQASRFQQVSVPPGAENDEWGLPSERAIPVNQHPKATPPFSGWISRPPLPPRLQQARVLPIREPEHLQPRGDTPSGVGHPLSDSQAASSPNYQSTWTSQLGFVDRSSGVPVWKPNEAETQQKRDAFPPLSASRIPNPTRDLHNLDYRYEPAPSAPASIEQEVDYGVERDDIVVGTLASKVRATTATANRSMPTAPPPLLPPHRARTLTEFVTNPPEFEQVIHCRAVVANERTKSWFEESAYFGKTIATALQLLDLDTETEDDETTDNSLRSLTPLKPRAHAQRTHPTPSPSQQVHINLSHPFTTVLCGDRHSGKTHTITTLLESFLLPTWNDSHPPDGEIIHTKSPHCVLVLHHSRDPDSICPFVRLTHPAPHVALDKETGSQLPRLSASRAVVLVSPASFVKRREAYLKVGQDARPLLFSWELLNARQVGLLLRLDPKEADHERVMKLVGSHDVPDLDQKPSFQTFLADLHALFPGGSLPPSLHHGLQLLSTFLADADRNNYRHPTNFSQLFKRGILVIADLTDACMLKKETHWEVTQMRRGDVEAGWGVVVVGGCGGCIY